MVFGIAEESNQIAQFSWVQIFCRHYSLSYFRNSNSTSQNIVIVSCLPGKTPCLQINWKYYSCSISIHYKCCVKYIDRNETSRISISRDDITFLKPKKLRKFLPFLSVLGTWTFWPKTQPSVRFSLFFACGPLRKNRGPGDHLRGPRQSTSPLPVHVCPSHRSAKTAPSPTTIFVQISQMPNRCRNSTPMGTWW